MRKGGRKEGAKDKEGERGEGEKKLQNLKWGRTRGEFLLPNLMRTAPAPAAPILDNLMMIKGKKEGRTRRGRKCCQAVTFSRLLQLKYNVAMAMAKVHFVGV